MQKAIIISLWVCCEVGVGIKLYSLWLCGPECSQQILQGKACVDILTAEDIICHPVKTNRVTLYLTSEITTVLFIQDMSAESDGRTL